MRIRLGTHKLRTLAGVVDEKIDIETETERAVLLRICRGPVVYRYWIPKSLVFVSETFIDIPDWFWEECRFSRR